MSPTKSKSLFTLHNFKKRHLYTAAVAGAFVNKNDENKAEVEKVGDLSSKYIHEKDRPWSSLSLSPCPLTIYSGTANKCARPYVSRLSRGGCESEKSGRLLSPLLSLALRSSLLFSPYKNKIERKRDFEKGYPHTCARRPEGKAKPVRGERERSELSFSCSLPARERTRRSPRSLTQIGRHVLSHARAVSIYTQGPAAFPASPRCM